MARILLLIVQDKLAQVLRRILATRLVAVGHHAERWMVAVCPQDGICLLIDESIDGLAIAECRRLICP